MTPNIEILSLMTPIHRVAYIVDDSDFTAKPGDFVQLLTTGKVQSVAPVSGGVPVVKLNISNWSSNMYESQDSKGIGKVTCIDQSGVRIEFKVGSYTGSISGRKGGEELIVMTSGANAGKLYFPDHADVTAGSYPSVATLESIAGDSIIVKMKSQSTYVKS